MRTKTLQFGNNNLEITFVEKRNKWCIPAKVVGKILNYAQDGQKLCDHISSKHWGMNFIDGTHYFIATANELAELKETPNFGVSAMASRLILPCYS